LPDLPGDAAATLWGDFSDWWLRFLGGASDLHLPDNVTVFLLKTNTQVAATNGYAALLATIFLTRIRFIETPHLVPIMHPS